MECLDRLQRAVNYFEKNIEQEVSLETAARVACYSRSHFCWIFKAATGYSPMEYVRERRLSRAASAILDGEKIADAVYRLGFSGQDAFTRSFKRKFGEPPGKFRQHVGRFSAYTPRLKLSSTEDMMILRYSGRMADYGGSTRLHRLLGEDAKRMIARVAVEPVRASDLDTRLLGDLTDASILVEDPGLVHLGCTVFLEEDIERAVEAAKPYGRKLASSLEATMSDAHALSDAIKHFIVDVLVPEAAAVAMANDGIALDWRTVSGAYAGCEIHFDEVCDAFDRAGPYGPNWNAGEGDTYNFIAVSEENVYSYTSFLYGAAVHADDQRTEAFMKRTEAYLTDSFARLILGEFQSESLTAAGESARLYENGRPVVQVIGHADAGPYLDTATRAKEAAARFVRENTDGFADILKSTRLHRVHGLSAEKSMTHLLRYVLRSATQMLSENGFFTDELSRRGLVALFYERDMDFWT